MRLQPLDWRGQGGSERPLPNMRKGHVADFADYDHDIKTFMKEIVLPDCPPPYVALGHSMGAHILLRNAVRPGSWFERMVLVAPMIRIDPERMRYPASVVRAYAEAGCLLGAGTFYLLGGGPQSAEQAPFDGNLLTSDRERWARNKAVLDYAPELGLGSPTIAWLRAATRSMAIVQDRNFPRAVQVPMLLFAAGPRQDRGDAAPLKTSVSASKSAANCCCPAHATEILQENDNIRMKFWAAFDAYLGVHEAGGLARLVTYSACLEHFVVQFGIARCHDAPAARG